MKGLARLLYNLNRLALFLLAVSFLSLFLLSIEGFEYLEPIAENATRYVPLLLVPVTITMIVVLLVRYMTKDRDEELGWEDFFAGVIAVGVQIVTVVTYGLVTGEDASFSLGIPDLSAINPQLGEAVERAATAVDAATQQAQDVMAQSADVVSETAAKFGWLGVAALQITAFIAYWIAKPDPRQR